MASMSSVGLVTLVLCDCEVHCSIQLEWTFTRYNAFNQAIISIRVPTTSMNDASLVGAYTRRARADAFYGRPQIEDADGSPIRNPYFRPKPIVTRRTVSDNPLILGDATIANTYVGQNEQISHPAADCPEWVITEDECNCAMALLYSDVEDDPDRMLGLDTENLPCPKGQQRRASLCQLSSAKRCVLCLLWLWPSCFKSFSNLLADASIIKVASSIKGDCTAIRQRFCVAGCKRCLGQCMAGGMPVNNTLELSSLTRQLLPNIANVKLGTIVKEVTGLDLDKRMDHTRWECQPYDPHQIAYATSDPYAHLICAKAIKAKLAVREGTSSAVSAAVQHPIVNVNTPADSDSDSDTSSVDSDGALPIKYTACTRYDCGLDCSYVLC